MTQDWKNIIASVDIADKPPGVRVLDWLTDRYEREENRRPRTVSAAIRAKIEAHELAQAAKAAKQRAQAITAVATAPAAPAPAHPHLAALDKLTGDAATLYFRQHRSAIIAEEADRQAAIADAQLRENSRAAKAGKGFASHI